MLEHERRESGRAVLRAQEQERSRIARELHDVVAHGLSTIVVQADGARYAAAKDPADRFPDAASMVAALEGRPGVYTADWAEMARKTVAVIGSGPAGLAAAQQLARASC